MATIESPIASPCVKVCTLDAAAGVCRGCGRTLVEIELWTRMSDAERRAIIEQLPARLHAQQDAAGRRAE
jgi:predicted Fe-S protein YdhL (DUF1289 family)